MNHWENEEDGLILECCAGLDIYKETVTSESRRGLR